MSDIEEPGTPPELPQEYAEIYRDAYLRALAETPPVHPETSGVENGDEAVPDADSGAGRVWMIVALIALLLIVAAYLAGDVLSGEEPPATGSPAASTTPGAARSRAPDPARSPSASAVASVEASQVPYDGPVAPAAVQSAEATCTAPPGVDSANQPVSYGVEFAIDADESTAWRCPGRARGETITFVLAPDSDVAEVGLIPGYAKTDPNSGADRYAENNRITKIRWTLSDGVVIDQWLDPDPLRRSLQSIRVPRTTTGQVTLEIRGVEPGVRNTTAISSVLIAVAV